ncbi:MAG: hypothetical protein QOE28_963 [Solirubrobacteraceae bacterium]|nr:hypothetical protein [Solirubrobacteraceae bacterium]
MTAAALQIAPARTWRLARAPLAAAAVVVGALALRLAALGSTPTDPYYDAAVRSMGASWHGFLFGALEPGGSVAIDKPPLDLWLQVASTKLLGFGPGALLLPEALGGTIAVLLLFVLLRRTFGLAEAVAGAAALAVLPVSVLTARSDTMDSVAVALTLGAAVLAVRDGRWALAGAGALVGLAFGVKVFQALIPVPALMVLYLAASTVPWRERLSRLAIAGSVATAVGLCWLAVVTLAPGRLQPWALGSKNGSAVEATFLYNGVERLSSTKPTSLRAQPAALLAERPDAPGPTRLLGAGGSLGLRLGAELVPALLAAAIALGLALATFLRSRPIRFGPAARRARPEPLPPAVRLRRAAALGLGAWLFTGLVLFSAVRGLQVRYLEAFAPAVAAVLGVAVIWLARRVRAPYWAAAVAVAALLAVPVQQSVALVEDHASDSGHIGAMPATEVAALSRYLTAHDGGARYEVASATAVKASALIAHDGRPVLMLDALARQPIVPANRLAFAVRRGEVRYLLAASGCGRGRCGPAVAWALAHGTDVTRAAGLPGRGVLFAMRPAAPVRTALRVHTRHPAAARRPS